MSLVGSVHEQKESRMVPVSSRTNRAERRMHLIEAEWQIAVLPLSNRRIMALRLRPPSDILRQAMLPRIPRLLASPSLLAVRSLHVVPKSQQAGLPPRGSGGGGSPGQPLGSIFGQQKKPGETLAEAGIDLTKLAAEGGYINATESSFYPQSLRMLYRQARSRSRTRRGDQAVCPITRQAGCIY